jgi:hypothetical protein
MKTWETNAPGFEITVLDYANIEPYLKKAGYPLSRFFKLPLPLQKDAVMAAVLLDEGGIFMDVDTIILRDFQPILEILNKSEILLFSSHLAFMTARPGASLIPIWATKIKEKLQHTEPNRLSNANWNFIGNSITNALFENSPANFVTRINKYNFAFTPESLRFLGKGIPRHQYQVYWFEQRDQMTPFYQNQFLIALHNSWTPDWYKQLTEDEILEDDCLLSVTLKNVLQKQHRHFKKKPIPATQGQKRSTRIGLKPSIFFQKIKWLFK